MRLKQLLAILAIVLSAKLAGAHEISRIIDTINATFSSFYAPKQWKESYLNWSLEAEIERVSANHENLMLRDFHQRLKYFFQSTRDYHTTIWFTDSATSTLPISIKYIDGKFYVAFIDTTQAGSNCGLSLGDEITHFNDQEVRSLALKLMGSFDNPTLTDWALAAKKLTHRQGKSGNPIEKGSVVIKALRNNKEVIAQLIWTYNPNEVRFNSTLKKTKYNLRDDIPLELHAALTKMLEHIESRSFMFSHVDLSNTSTSTDQSGKDPMAMAAKPSYLGNLSGVELWRAPETNNFQAYIS
ncbi:MAG TPA: PDZ domain-containing protein, partial [Myxococcota bacterium]|nr:PDZ domain-containing protein [Myxococcota bacterium]